MAANDDAAASRRNFLRSGAMTALAGVAGAAPAVSAAAQGEKVSPELSRLIEAHLRARDATWAAFDLAGDDDTDRRRLGITDEEADRAYNEASDIEMAAIGAVCRHSCRSIEDARAWAHHLIEQKDILDGDDFFAALCALAGLPVEDAEA